MRLRAVFILLWALLVLRAIVTISPSTWFWGFDSLADGPAVVGVLGVCLFAAAVIPPIGRAAAKAAAGAERSLTRGRAGITILTVIAVVAILAALRSNNILLGDSQTWLSALDKGVRAAGGAHREPLPQALVTGLHNVIASPGRWGPHETFTLLGSILGIGFLLLAVGIARALARATPGRLIVFSTLALGGGLQLFAGYPEFYGFAVTAILLFAFLGLRVTHGGGKALPAAMVFVVAGLCHAQVAFAFPAVLYLLWLSWRTGRRKEAILSLAAIPVATMIALVVLRYPFQEIGKEAGRAGALLPPLGALTARTAYGIFAVRHLSDLCNVLLLVSPVLPAAVALAWGARIRFDPRHTFLALLAAGPVLFAAVANPELGMVRDWDIFALPATLITLFVAAFAAERLDREAAANGPGLKAANGAAGCIFLFALLHAGFWIVENHDPARAIERMRRIASDTAIFGPRSLSETWRYIGSTDMLEGNPERAAASYLRAVRSDPDEKMTYRFLATNRIAGALEAGRSAESGLAEYHTEVEAGKRRAAYAFLGGALASVSSGRLDLALREASRMIEAEPDYPELLAVRGDLLRISGDDAGAEAAYARALARDPSHPRARIGNACLAGIRGDRAETESQLEETLRRTPWSPQAQQFARQPRQ